LILFVVNLNELDMVLSGIVGIDNPYTTPNSLTLECFACELFDFVEIAEDVFMTL